MRCASAAYELLRVTGYYLSRQTMQTQLCCRQSELRLQCRFSTATGPVVLIIVPESISLNGPLLGVAKLSSAISRAGGDPYLCDMNALARSASPTVSHMSPGMEMAGTRQFRGDHDKDSRLCVVAASDYHAAVRTSFETLPRTFGTVAQAVKHMWYPWDSVIRGAERVIQGSYGRRMHVALTTYRQRLAPATMLREFTALPLPANSQARALATPTPQIIAISVMFGGQIPGAIAATVQARLLFPDALVVWGGPHIMALKEAISKQPENYAEGCGGVDIFVFGYAELTVAAILSDVARGALKRGSRESSPLCTHERAKVLLYSFAGCGEKGSRSVGAWPLLLEGHYRASVDLPAPPLFPVDLSPYASIGASLTIPVQLRRGCAYNLCAFCTYPKVEGDPQGSAALSATVLGSCGAFELASHLRTQLRAIEGYSKLPLPAVSLKDALVSTLDLMATARHAQRATAACSRGDTLGHVEWSACTKLRTSLAQPQVLSSLHSAGCRTIELGIETLDLPTAQNIRKPQSPALLGTMLDAAAKVQLPLVLNYITGFPGRATEQEMALRSLQEEVRRRTVCDGLVARVEHNYFQLERLSDMGRSPEQFGCVLECDATEVPLATVLPHRDRIVRP